MKLKMPELTENYQLEIIECENQTVQDFINGMFLAFVVITPIALFTPRPI